MCLIRDEEETQDFKKLGEKVEYVTCWKILEVFTEFENYMDRESKRTKKIKSPFREYFWKPGVNEREIRPVGTPAPDLDDNIGIHVFLNMNDAHDYFIRRLENEHFPAFVTPVKCFIKDLIAVGDFEYKDYFECDGDPRITHYKTATFTQVTLDPKDYEQNLKG